MCTIDVSVAVANGKSEEEIACKFGCCTCNFSFYLKASLISFLGPWCQVPMPRMGIFCPLLRVMSFIFSDDMMTSKNR